MNYQKSKVSQGAKRSGAGREGPNCTWKNFSKSFEKSLDNIWDRVIMQIEQKFYYIRKEIMKYMEYWSNDACEGYAIMAMEDAGLDNETIRKVLRIMSYDLFDSVSIKEAEDYYYKKSF